MRGLTVPKYQMLSLETALYFSRCRECQKRLNLLNIWVTSLVKPGSPKIFVEAKKKKKKKKKNYQENHTHTHKKNAFTG